MFCCLLHLRSYQNAVWLTLWKEVAAVPSLPCSAISWPNSMRHLIFPATAKRSTYRDLILLAILGLGVIMMLAIRTSWCLAWTEASIWPRFYVRHERECCLACHCRSFSASFLIWSPSCYFVWEFRQSPNQKKSWMKMKTPPIQSIRFRLHHRRLPGCTSYPTKNFPWSLFSFLPISLICSMILVVEQVFSLLCSFSLGHHWLLRAFILTLVLLILDEVPQQARLTACYSSTTWDYLPS